ncbi:hypothetical protein C0991_009620, partial [Blastosporella zonata]
MFNGWTSKPYDPYFAVTAHYIDAPAKTPNNWKLCAELIGYTPIKGNHGGSNTAATILKVIDHYNIHSK